MKLFTAKPENYEPDKVLKKYQRLLKKFNPKLCKFEGDEWELPCTVVYPYYLEIEVSTTNDLKEIIKILGNGIVLEINHDGELVGIIYDFWLE